MTTQTFIPGTRVRILTGMAGGRAGTVLHAGRGYGGPVVNVEVEIPVLLTDPDGPSQTVQMPYAPEELEAVEPEPAAGAVVVDDAANACPYCGDDLAVCGGDCEDEVEPAAHRPAVAPVPDVVFAENGAAVAPPPQARRGFSQAGLASVLRPNVAAGLHRAHTAEHAARALAAYVRAVELGQDINSHYEAAVAAAHSWTEVDQ